MISRPWMVLVLVLVLAAAVLVPVLIIGHLRQTTTTVPRVHLIPDMDDQPKYKAQRASGLFDDGRVMRPPVAETLARGDLPRDLPYVTGKIGEQWAPVFPPVVAVNDALERRGRERFNVFCAPCHGLGGAGDGIVSARAQALGEAAWVKPASLHDQRICRQPVGQFFNTISQGQATMPGYAAQIPVADRWAIVAYVRALQRGQVAGPGGKERGADDVREQADQSRDREGAVRLPGGRTAP